MKKILAILLSLAFLLSIQTVSLAQKSYGNLYDPETNAADDIEALIVQAKKEKKHIILQVGGNWCGWCYLFHDFIEANNEVKEIADQNYLTYHLNHSQDNKNLDLLNKYSHPERFGFPVLLILNSEGILVHTQNSALLEEGKGYNVKKVKEFFTGWTPTALDPASYKEKQEKQEEQEEKEEKD
ncbi:MAG: thiol:disulfide interchange protein [Saprospiraceae bacterium]|jgi:thiol:disulfide interchange protein